MANVLTPMLRSIYLCDRVVSEKGSSLNLEGLFTSLKPEVFPHRSPSIIIFAQMAGGLGPTTSHVEVHCGSRGQQLFATKKRVVNFTDRLKTYYVAHKIENFTFSQPGLYLFEYYCNNVLMGDVPAKVR